MIFRGSGNTGLGIAVEGGELVVQSVNHIVPVYHREDICTVDAGLGGPCKGETEKKNKVYNIHYYVRQRINML